MALLRGTTKTVDDLAKLLELTDNAVRAHLATLEPDGLVRQSGMRRGLRKPHYQYSLTAEAEDLFPKAYDAVLNQLISVLRARIGPEVLEESLREVGRSMGIAYGSGAESKSLEARVEAAAKATIRGLLGAEQDLGLLIGVEPGERLSLTILCY